MLLQLCDKQMLVQMEGKKKKKQKRHFLCGYSELNQSLLYVGL